MYSRTASYLPSIILSPLRFQSRSLTTLRTCRRELVIPRRPLSVRFLFDAAPSSSTDDSDAASTVAAQKNAETLNSYAPIPSPPPQSLLYPLVQEDISRYLKPMYTRRWSVKWNNRQLHPTKGTLFLAKTFKLVDYEATMSFLRDIAIIVREENHHPEIAFNYRTVKIQTQTHRIAGPSIPIPDADGKIIRTPPGLTLNDARLAIRIEKLFTDVYLADGRGRPTGDNANVLTTPETLEEMEVLAARSLRRLRTDKTKRLAENEHSDTE
ncbi:hypothetical protein PILCRDRAFT_826793 [Piloderma croceum F 1598]|uniref:4a-hydroxytetrahydrobiopterin dehydratase n=1 Tax=Piloderma croceum (strain F 1598) TaxID=765440 RepID=A0A0C3BF62_PILCF|nr:hypothetical protein PILCRDRAFT_826793 [Piloderma croceum F 1598]